MQQLLSERAGGEKEGSIHTYYYLLVLMACPPVRPPISYRYKKKINKIQSKHGAPLGCATPTAKEQQNNDVSADEQKHEKMLPLNSAGEAGDANATDTLNILSHLTGMPHVDDTLLQAVPVCAPYVVLRDYKYKYGDVFGGVEMRRLNSNDGTAPTRTNPLTALCCDDVG